MIRKVSKRRFVAALAVSALLLAACGTGTSNDDAAEPDDDGGTEEPGPADTEPPSTLTVWFPGNSEPEIELVTQTLIPDFEEANNVDVEVTYVDWADMSPKLNAAFAGDIAPDLFGHGAAATAGFVEADRVEPLDAYIAELPQADQDDLATVLDQARVDGSAYMAPLSVQGTLIAYRKDLFAEAGLDPENPPATWEDAYEAAQALTVRDGDRVEVAGLWLPSAAIPSTQTFGSLLASEGGSLLSADGSATAWSSPEGVRALEYFAKLFDGDEPVADQIGSEFGSQPAAQHPLATGAAAMAILTSGEVMRIINAVLDVADQIGVMAPLSAVEAKMFGGTGTGLFINKDSDNTAMAWKFVEYMLSPDVSETYAQSTGSLPARASAADGEYVSSQPLLEPFVEAAQAYVPNPNVPKWVEVRDVLGKHIEQALHGQVSAADALAAAAAEADDLLAG